MTKPTNLRARLGRFRISGQVRAAVWTGLEGAFAQSLMELFGQMIVIRASDAPHMDSTDYWAVSPLFEEIEEGAIVPWYFIEWQTIDHGEDYAEKGFSHRCETVAKAIRQSEPPSEVW